MRALIRSSLLPALALAAAACGGDSKSDVQPVINSFTVSSNTVSAGDTVTLTWDVTDATGVTITQDGATVVVSNDARPTGTAPSNPIDRALDFKLTAVNSESGLQAEATAQIIAVAGIRIAEFTVTPETVDEGATVTLSFKIGGEAPTEVIIEDQTGAEVYDDAQQEDTLQLVPDPDENGVATYTLSVEGPSGSDTASVMVNVNNIITTPVIVDFSAVSTDIAKGQRAQLRWELQDAVEVQISLNGNVARPFTDVGVPTGNTRITVEEDMNVFLLEAKSEDDVIVSQELMIRGLEVPVVTTFELSPTAYTQASTIATVTWETMHADSTNLQVNGRDVAMFPRTQAAGTFSFGVTGEATVTFIATNPVQDTQVTSRIALGFDEPEPNNTPAQALPINPDGNPVRGTIADLTDVDWYILMVPQGASLWAQVGYDETSGCSFDTILRMYDSDGATELGFADNTLQPAISPCSEINPIVDNYAANLPAGTYYISVGGGSGVSTTGQYSLSIRVLTPVPDVPTRMAALRIGDPTWQIDDFVQFQGPFDTALASPPDEALDPILRPMHRIEGLSNFSAIMRPEVAHRPDYTTELRMTLDMRGVRSHNVFNAADVQVPNGLYVAWTLSPNVSTATTGMTVDFANGPIIPTALFPITTDIEIESGGMPLGLNTDYDLPAASTFDPPVPGDGASHTHMVAFAPFSDAAAPADLAGDYEWVVTLLDSGMNGWTFKVPFTLQ